MWRREEKSDAGAISSSTAPCRESSSWSAFPTCVCSSGLNKTLALM